MVVRGKRNSERARIFPRCCTVTHLSTDHDDDVENTINVASSSNYDTRRVCVNPFPFLERINLGNRRTLGFYLAGGLVSPPFPPGCNQPSTHICSLSFEQFSLGLLTFFDTAFLFAHAYPPYNESDYPVPGICSLLGILVINLIDKDRIRGEEGFGDSRAVWRARLFLFVGFALMAGGLAGSVVRSSSFPTNALRSTDTDHI
jgi:hypothetical protein